jgi:hypothetical protein
LASFVVNCDVCGAAMEQVESASLVRQRPVYLCQDCVSTASLAAATWARSLASRRKNQKFISSGNPAKTLLDGTFQQGCGSAVALFNRSNSFIVGAQFLPSQNVARLYFEGLADGTRHALLENRRSGAQRGAPENNFGQRFSWAPLA